MSKTFTYKFPSALLLLLISAYSMSFAGDFVDHRGKKATSLDKDGRPIVISGEARKPYVWLYNQRENTLTKTDAESKLLPDRVYRRWDSEVQSWVFELTGPNGGFGNPSRFLIFGTVLDGEWIGEEPGTRWIYRDGGGEIWDEWTKLSDSDISIKKLNSVSLGNGKRVIWEGTDHRLKVGGLDPPKR